MANYGRVEFRSARASGILVNHLGSGVPDHLGFYGDGGTATAIEVNSWNQTTFITDESGDVPAYLGEASGALTNCKYIDGSTVAISGWTAVITNVNKLNISDLNPAQYPNFTNRPSGTLLIRYLASGVSNVHTYNAKLWAYDTDVDINTAPGDVTVMAFDINASGKWYNSAHSGVWRSIGGSANPMYFCDHSPAKGFQAKNEHIWVAAISAKPLAVGALNFGLVFSMQYV